MKYDTDKAKSVSGAALCQSNALKEAQPVARNMSSGKSIAFRYGAAVLIVASAAFLRLVLLEGLGPLRAPYITLYPAATLAALVGGVGPGVFATLFSALVASFFLIEPVGDFAIRDSHD